MGWPPQAGEPLPRAQEACGVRRKLAAYSLDPLHESGGPKAEGFARLLGVTIESIDYLEVEIYRAARRIPVRSIRRNREGGYNCVIEFPMRGTGAKADRIVPVRTVWELTGPSSRPRLVTAFPSP